MTESEQLHSEADGAGRRTERSAQPFSDVDLPTRMLVFGVARHDGSIPAGEVFAAAEACGRSAERVRSCLRRLVTERLFDREGVGQRATYRPTDDGLRALVEFGGRALRALQAHARDTAPVSWDGLWHLVTFAVPEPRRWFRDEFRFRLGILGGAAVHNGVYVSPHAWDKDVTAAAETLDIVEHVTLARSDHLVVGGVSDPREVAARLWPLDAVAADYQAFLDRWTPVIDVMTDMQRRDEQLPDSAFLPGALAMALAYLDCVDADPLLPAELLPQPWPGRAARDLLVNTRRLALRIRAERGRPALFAAFDDLLGTLPDSASPRPGVGGDSVTPGSAGDDASHDRSPDEHDDHRPHPDLDHAADRRSPGGPT